MRETFATVAALWRYPVKSMLGEPVVAAEVTGYGLTGDRRLALLHRDTGKVASAKHPRLWRGLFRLAARLDGGAVVITLADGRTVRSDQADVDDVLSAELGQPVTLAATVAPGAVLDRAVPDEVLRGGEEAEVPVAASTLAGSAPAGTLFDAAPVHLVTTATLARIGELSARGTMEAVRYRPNLVLDVGGAGFVENGWHGRRLRIGEELELEVTAATVRCAVPTLEHGDLPRDPDALRVPARHNRVPPGPGREPDPCVGVYAQVRRPGRIRVGDPVRLAGTAEPDQVAASGAAHDDQG